MEKPEKRDQDKPCRIVDAWVGAHDDNKAEKKKEEAGYNTDTHAHN